jgi:predicted DNA-binding ArsR family transcriptional regulator
MKKRTLILILWVFVQSIGYTQTSVPLGFCTFSFDASDTTDYTNIEKFLGKYKAKLSASQQTSIINEFKTQICVNINPAYTGWHNYKHLADALGVVTPKEEIEGWVTKIKKEMSEGEASMIIDRIIKDENIYQHTGFNEKAMVLDFDQNQTPDVICIPQVHFGPSIGYEVFAKKDGRWQSVFDYSGSFEGLEKTDNQIVIRYLVTIIEPTETEILLSVVLEKKDSNWVLKDLLKQYYASQTKKPAKFLTKFESFTAKSSTILRTHPLIKDTGMAGQSAMISAEMTKTLVGNQVGVFPKGSKALVLAKEKGWAFVAFLPNSKPQKNSLEHGMDRESNINPYYCGWIQVK